MAAARVVQGRADGAALAGDPMAASALVGREELLPLLDQGWIEGLLRGGVRRCCCLGRALDRG